MAERFPGVRRVCTAYPPVPALEGAVDTALFTQPVGTVCDPIVCPRDVYVVKILERVEGRTIPFTEVQGEIETAVRNAKFEEMVGEYLQRLYEKAYIKIYEENL